METVRGIVTNIVFVALAFAFAFFMSYIITPLIKKLATRVGAIDVPEDDRRMHKRPIPRLGGIAIFIAFLLGVLIFVTFTGDNKAYIYMLIASFLIVGMGIVDDIRNLNAWIKLAVQIVAALIVVMNGVVIETMFGYELGNWAYPITMIWIVGITNAINLIDGLDGLACGVSTISAVALLIVAVLVPGPDMTTIIVTAVLIGSCSGFLPYNVYPAKIFMGDVGSMLLGFVLSVISVEGSFKASFVAPLLVLGFPILDTLMAVFRRIRKKQSVFQADRKHFHHRLIDMGLNHKQSVSLLWGVSALLGIAAILLTVGEPLPAAIIMIVSLAVGLVNWFVMKGESNTEGNGCQPNMSTEEEKDKKT